MRRAAALVVACLLTLAACGGSGETQLVGTVTLLDADGSGIEAGVSDGSTYCTGIGGYSNIHPGAEVMVLDGSGAIVGVGDLSRGDGTTVLCIFGFTVPVKQADFYTIEIARRAGPTYSHDELVADEWTVSLSLGD